MGDINWFGLDNNVVHWLPKIGRYTEIEALISYTLDVKSNKEFSINGYASLWGWSRNKVRRFIDDLGSIERTGSGHLLDRQRTVSGQEVTFKNTNLENRKDKQGTSKGQAEDSRKDTTNKTKTKTNTNNTFIPPSSEEVLAYCIERANGIDPDTFIDYYETNGWMRGKSKIKSWKACIRTWEKNGNNNGTMKTVQPSEQFNMLDEMRNHR